jgi:hypothetical protein
MSASYSETLHSPSQWYKWVPHVLRHCISIRMWCKWVQWCTHLYHSQGICSVSEHEALIYIPAKGYAVSLNMRHSFISYPKSYAVSLNMRHSYTSLPKGYAVSLNMRRSSISHLKGYAVSLNMRHSSISHPKGYAVSQNMSHSFTSHPKGYAVSQNMSHSFISQPRAMQCLWTCSPWQRYK